MYLPYKEIQILKEWKRRALGNGKDNRIFAYTLDEDGVLTVSSDSPGWIIGFKGNLIFEYMEKLKKSNADIKKVLIKEIHKI